MIASNRSENVTLDGGVSSTITYVDEDTAAKTIKLFRKRSESEMVNLIICANEEFDRMGAEATFAFPEGQM
jgi:hypothetical protein